MPRLRVLLRAHRWFLIVVTTFIALAIWYNVATPIGESDHELSHYRYTQYVKANWQLPSIDYVWPAVKTEDQCKYPFESGLGLEQRQFRQPPLYYALNAFTFLWLDTSDNWWPTPNEYGYHAGNFDGGINAFIHSLAEEDLHSNVVVAVKLHRLFSTITGMLGLLATYLTGLLLFPSRQKYAAVLMTAAVAFVPAYIFSSSVISNDILVGVLGLWCIFFCLKSVLGDTPSLKAFAAAALCLALAFLAKYSAVTIALPFAITSIYLLVRSFRQDGKTFRHTIVALTLIIAVQLILVGLWFWRNQQQYKDIFVGYNVSNLSVSSRILYFLELTQGTLLSDLSDGLKFTSFTYWGLLGADAITLPQWLLSIMALIGLAVFTGLFYKLLTNRTVVRDKLLIIVGIFCVLGTWLLIYTWIFYGPRGRYILSLYSIIAYLIISGISVWRTRRFPWLGGYLYIGLVLLVALFVPPFLLQPAFAAPPMETNANLRQGEAPIHAYVNDFAELVGMSILPQDIGPYSPVDVTLIWRVLDTTSNSYAVGVHLIGSDNTYLGGTTHASGKGNYPTSLWQPGDVFRDTYRIHTESAEEMSLPTAARVKVSVICPGLEGTNHQSFYTADRERIGSAIYSEPVRFGLPEVMPTVHQSDRYLAQFGETLILTHANLPTIAQQPGWSLPVVLRWRTLSAGAHDTKLSIQLLDADGNWILGSDGSPSETLPPELWRAGDTLHATRWLDLPDNLAPGEYTVIVALYHASDLTRITTYDRLGNTLESNAHSLGTISISSTPSGD